MARNQAGLSHAITAIQDLKKAFWADLKIPGDNSHLNIELERASRVADFLDLGELMCQDALHREESCGGHFRTEYQTKDGEALRNDKDFAYVGVWEYQDTHLPKLHKEPLIYEEVQFATRSYK